MKTSLSLRARLIGIILCPLVFVAALFGGWAYYDAQSNAAERFDRSLLSTALAISRDTAVSGGDALSEETRDLLRDTSGGAVFYHVYAPDGVFVTGYATPPVPREQVAPEATQTYYDAIYQNAPVRALRFSQSTSIDGLSGPFTFTVWQATSVRDGFVASRTWPVFLVIAAMISALFVIVWFGVARGLAPLIDLEDAIASRSAEDLSPIKRKIPQETSGIVARFNNLVGELSKTLDAKNVFISDAAHQLRNPIAGVLSLAESVANAKTLDSAHERSWDLLIAARDTAHLANNLLTLERAQTAQTHMNVSEFDPNSVLETIAAKVTAAQADAPFTFTSHLTSAHVRLKGDPIMFEQAILNLINNASIHGGPTLTQIDLLSEAAETFFRVTVRDDGQGIPKELFAQALGRFRQIGSGPGTGLGLPITAAVTSSFGGTLKPITQDGSFALTLTFPLAAVQQNVFQ